MNTHYIPSLTCAAGQVLTVADWASVGVNIASCDLASLLIKPGLKTLEQLNHLKAYWDWPGELLLDLSSLSFDSFDKCSIRSPFDGRTICFTKEAILNLVEHLNPDYKSLSFQNNTHTLRMNNKPSEDALKGFIYTKNTTFSICDETQAKHFEVLDSSCACSACKAGFTRAYFHHLYLHTPLLCHRWLIMHNQWMIHNTDYYSSGGTP
ncbi:MAG: hypothetical protein K0U37_03320 [Gammaproteobacteria bacterium]|nr:hypothetical protein [Gammaproteobacteria bacterium]